MMDGWMDDGQMYDFIVRKASFQQWYALTPDSDFTANLP